MKFCKSSTSLKNIPMFETYPWSIRYSTAYWLSMTLCLWLMQGSYLTWSRLCFPYLSPTDHVRYSHTYPPSSSHRTSPTNLVQTQFSVKYLKPRQFQWATKKMHFSKKYLHQNFNERTKRKTETDNIWRLLSCLLHKAPPKQQKSKGGENPELFFKTLWVWFLNMVSGY